jgi:hypothetical protein
MEISQRVVKELIKQFTGQAQVLTIPRPYIKLTGDHECALMLNQIVYWSERTEDPEGWFYKTHDDWAKELELTPAQVRRITKKLEEVGVESKLKKHNGAPKLHYRINDEVFYKALHGFLEGQSQPTIKKVDNQQSALSIPTLSDPIINFPDNQHSSLSDSAQSEDSDSELSSYSSSKDAKITTETTQRLHPHTARSAPPGSNGVGVKESKYPPDLRKDYARKHGLGAGWLNTSADGRYDAGIELQLERDALEEQAKTRDTRGQPIRDTSLCPDCGGSGFKPSVSGQPGVAKCTHPRLDEEVRRSEKEVESRAAT